MSRAKIVDLLVERPRTATEIAGVFDATPDAVRRVLRALAEKDLVAPDHTSYRTTWNISPKVRCLAGAAGGVWVNGMVTDHRGVPIPGTQFAKRRTSRLRDVTEVVRELGEVMAQAACTLPRADRKRLAGVGLALPFGLSESGQATSFVESSSSAYVPDHLNSSLRANCPDLPRWDDWSRRWAITSDVAGEAVSEYHHGRADQGSGRISPARQSPLMIVKAHREIRFALLEDGEGIDKGGVDLGHVRASLDRLIEPGQAVTLRPETEAELLRRFQSPGSPCPVCGQRNQCLQMVVSPETLHELAGLGEYQAAFDAARGSLEEARTDSEMFRQIFGAALIDEDHEAAALFRTAGRVLGRALDPLVTLHRPPVLIITGFLSRTKHFRRGVRDALGHHFSEPSPLSIITASGIRGEEGDPPPDRDDPVQWLAHQYWPTAGAARLALDRIILPRLRDEAAAS